MIRLPPPSKWTARQKPLAQTEYARFDGVLQIAGPGAAPFDKLLAAAAKKRGGKPFFATEPGGAAVSQLRPRKTAPLFETLESMRRALEPLSGCRSLAADIRAPHTAAAAVYAALVNAARLPGDSRKPQRITFAGCAPAAVADAAAAAEANILARALCRLPPNELTVPVFAKTASALARKQKLAVKVFDSKLLARMGAGAILAVGRASVSPPQIVRIRYRGAGTAPHIALVGKGVCYDTGGINIKPARHMRGMKGDMAGAAAVLAAVLAAAKRRARANIDAYLVLADNAAGPAAYRPDEVVVSLSGKTIEIVHSDAEGRMILADALTLAARQKPGAVVSFATLTGTMTVALGRRMSGFFATDPRWRKKAARAAENSGERLCEFPAAADYRESLKSDIADIKQCAEEGEADHIMAAVFLREFIEGAPPWLHLDLSASSCKGGLGAAPGPETGFGAAWAFELIKTAAQ